MNVFSVPYQSTRLLRRSGRVVVTVIRSHIVGYRFYSVPQRCEQRSYTKEERLLSHALTLTKWTSRPGAQDLHRYKLHISQLYTDKRGNECSLIIRMWFRFRMFASAFFREMSTSQLCCVAWLSSFFNRRWRHTSASGLPYTAMESRSRL